MGKRLDNGKRRREKKIPSAFSCASSETQKTVLLPVSPYVRPQIKNQRLQGWRKIEAKRDIPVPKELSYWLAIPKIKILKEGYVHYSVKNPKPLPKGDIYRVWHGTSINSLVGILCSGFEPSHGGLLGKGIYVGEWEKAAKFRKSSERRIRIEEGEKRWDIGKSVMILCRANLGKIQTVRNPVLFDASILKKEMNTTAGKAAFTTAFGGTLNYNEWCLKNAYQIAAIEVFIEIFKENEAQ